ncbi:glycosyltransferase family 39 protein [Paenibacillus hamazuiensis]|uniref:glycosyltransferase family 39 protein n=1 Tax=Paenibacillus hamazuiensis TaxID=2936508 RepID=UPI00200DA538|nr:glycosyltransferase family 39 protein [Paenibacillus hamazuiensis]
MDLFYQKYLYRLNQIYHKYKEPAYRLYDRYKDCDFIYYIPFALLSLNVRISHYFYRLKPGNSLPQADDSQWYIDYARNLLAHFKIGLEMNDILYFGYNVLLAVLLAIFKDPHAIIIIQAITAGLSVILVYKIAKILFNRLTAVLACYFFYDKYDITLWAMYILSDSFFISLLLLCVYLLLKSFESEKRIYKILFAASALYMIVFRPAGIITIAFILVYILLRMPGQKLLGFLKKYRLAIGGVLVAGLSAVIFLYAGHKLDPLITSMQFNAKKVLYNIYARGWIYDKPSDYDMPYKPNYNINILNSLILSFIINNWDHVLALYGRRIIAFLGSWVWKTDVSSMKGIFNLLVNLIPTVLFLLGTYAAIANKLFRRASILWLLVLSVFVFCIVFFIDGMYRYKAPGIPFIVIIAAYGADIVIRRLIVVAKKYVGMRVWDKIGFKEKH